MKWTKYWKFLINEADVGVLFFQFLKRREHALAIAAVVVEELDDRDFAVRVAGDRRGGIVEQRLAVLGDDGAHVFRFGGLLALAQPLENVDDQLGVAKKKFLECFLHRLLRLGRRRMPSARGSARHADGCKRQGHQKSDIWKRNLLRVSRVAERDRVGDRLARTAPCLSSVAAGG